MPAPVIVAEYDPRWPARFARLRDQLAAALGPLAIRIEHVGSTPVPGREAFSVPPGSPPHHLYVCPAGSRALTRHLALRNRLRADPVAAAAYADLKRALAARFRHDRDAYTEGKTAFIDSLLPSRDRLVHQDRLGPARRSPRRSP